MSRKYKITDQDCLYFVTFTVIHWLDVFTRKMYRDIVLDGVRYCQEHKGLDVYAYCIMSNHVHMVIGSQRRFPLEGIIRDLKKYTSVKIIEAIRLNPLESRRTQLLSFFSAAGEANSNNTRYQFWQQHSHPITLFTAKFIHEKINYIHYNPVAAGIVKSPEDYLYSSAVDYLGKSKGLLNLIVIDPEFEDLK